MRSHDKTFAMKQVFPYMWDLNTNALNNSLLPVVCGSNQIFSIILFFVLFFNPGDNFTTLQSWVKWFLYCASQMWLEPKSRMQVEMTQLKLGIIHTNNKWWGWDHWYQVKNQDLKGLSLSQDQEWDFGAVEEVKLSWGQVLKKSAFNILGLIRLIYHHP